MKHKSNKINSVSKTEDIKEDNNNVIDVFAEEINNIDIDVDSKELSYLILGSDELMKKIKSNKNRYEPVDTTPISFLKEKLEKKLVELTISNNHKSDSGFENDRKSDLLIQKPNQKKIRHCSLYTERRHLKNVNKTVKKLYQLFKDNMIEMDRNFEVVPTLTYIGFKMARKSIVNVIVSKKKMVIHFHPPQIIDSLKQIEELPYYYRGIGRYRITVTSEDTLLYVLSLVEQILLSEPGQYSDNDVAA